MNPSETRYHALDSLRAVMMFLGIYLHAVVAYSPADGWPFKQQELSSTLNWSLGMVHLFRMPVFYVLAGFFGALLYARRGMLRWVENRARRVLIPFVGGWVILFPLVLFLTALGKNGWSGAVQFMVSGGFLKFAHPMHLWFLEYLILLYAIAVVAVVTVPRLPSLERYFRIVAGWWSGPVVFAVASFAALLPMQYAGLEDPPGFLPVPRIVIAYLVPFTFGWLLFGDRDLLETMARRAWIYFLMALPLLALYAGLLRVPLARGVSFYADRAVHSVALWLLIYGLIGVFMWYLSAESPKMRYLSDSAHFLYLGHMPALIVLQLALVPVVLPPLAKAGIVLAGAPAILLPVYHYWVRRGWLGEVLNGRRYPAPL
jgi:glucan biosynthesis protein C